MQATQSLRMAFSRDNSESRHLVAWIFCWIILPNAGFWLLWVVGAPPRYPEILATGAVGIVVRRRAYAVRLCAFLLALAYSILSFVAALFNLAIVSLVQSIQFLVEMHPTQSVEYLACAAGVAITVIVAARMLTLRTDFVSTSALVAAAALTVGSAGLDYWMSFGMRGAYKRSAPAGAPFSSAVSESGFLDGADQQRNLVLVVVESMGLPTDRDMREQLFARFRQPDIASRYEMTHGAAPYFGSTTSAEIRELCERWGDYYGLVDREDRKCLPAQLERSGYQTTAVHSFDGSFFKRQQWYPNIGFEAELFRASLLDKGADGCPGVFPAACDRDVPLIIYNRLRNAKGPQFLYWLTVNSHLPVPSAEELQTANCRNDQIAAVRKYPMICRQFELWEQVEDSLAQQIVKKDFPDADILLVGDHMPPYFDRAQRSEFDPAHVPWILLRRRADVITDADDRGLS